MRGLDLEAEVLRHEISSLFSDQQSRRVGVGPEIVGADTQVNDLEVLSAENVETPINDTSFFPRLHGARSQAVPGGLDMVGDPVVDGLVVFLGILDILVNLAGVVGIAWLVPSAHVDSEVNPLGRMPFAVWMSRSFAAAGDAGWKRGWWEVNSPRKASILLATSRVFL